MIDFYLCFLITTCLLLLGISAYATLLVVHYDLESWPDDDYSHTLMYIVMFGLIALITCALCSFTYDKPFICFPLIFVMIIINPLLIPVLLTHKKNTKWKIYKQSLFLFLLFVVEYVVLISNKLEL